MIVVEVRGNGEVDKGSPDLAQLEAKVLASHGRALIRSLVDLQEGIPNRILYLGFILALEETLNGNVRDDKHQISKASVGGDAAGVLVCLLHDQAGDAVVRQIDQLFGQHVERSKQILFTSASPEADDLIQNVIA